MMELGDVIEVTSLGGKRFRHDDLFNQSPEPVSGFLHCFADGIDCWSISKLKITSEAVGHHFADHRTTKLRFFFRQQVVLEIVQITDFCTIAEPC